MQNQQRLVSSSENKVKEWLKSLLRSEVVGLSTKCMPVQYLFWCELLLITYAGSFDPSLAAIQLFLETIEREES